MLRAFLTDESGATSIEYGLVAALLAMIVIVALSSVGEGLSGTFDSVAAGLEGPGSGDRQ